MAKPKMYGLKSKYKNRLHVDMRYLKRQRQRESTTRKPVPAQIAKEKEAQE